MMLPLLLSLAAAAESVPAVSAGRPALLPILASAAPRDDIVMPPPASPPPPHGPARTGNDRLLGDWAGVRTTLTDAGFTPTIAHVNHTLTNIRGGTRGTLRNAGQFTFGLTTDMEKVAGLPGTVQMTVVARYGESFNALNGINALVNPMSIQGRGEIWRVSQLWYRTTVAGVDVKLGRMFFNEDFNISRCDFVNGYFCLGENTRVASASWPTSPVSEWAVRVQKDVGGGVTLKAGAYLYDPTNLDMTKNFYIGARDITGIVAPVEAALATRINGLPGTYSIGLLYSNADMADPVLNTRHQIRAIAGGSALIRREQWGGWITARQQLTRARPDGSNNLSVFFNLSQFTSQTPSNENAMALGLNYTGLIKGRPRDEIGLAFGSARVNHRITDAARIVNANGGNQAIRTREYAVEAYYGIAVMPGVTVNPDIQFIFDPAGDAARRNVVIVGARTAITF
ncbi:MAG: carbohydrate porin [Sphingobium sp.]